MLNDRYSMFLFLWFMLCCFCVLLFFPFLLGWCNQPARGLVEVCILVALFLFFEVGWLEDAENEGWYIHM